jgi:hypothetical protein
MSAIVPNGRALVRVPRLLIRWVFRCLWKGIRILLIVAAAMAPGLPPPPPPPPQTMEQHDTDGELATEER